MVLSVADIQAIPGLEDVNTVRIAKVLARVTMFEDPIFWGDCLDEAIEAKTAAMLLAEKNGGAGGSVSSVSGSQGRSSSGSISFSGGPSGLYGWRQTIHGQNYLKLSQIVAGTMAECVNINGEGIDGY